MQHPLGRSGIDPCAEVEAAQVEEQRCGEAERVDAVHEAAVAGDGAAPVFGPEVALPGKQYPAVPALISFVLIVYKMPDQAEKTLYSLSTRYQRGVTESDYEVIVVENSSNAPLGEERACQYGSNVRYFYREETLPTPVPAVNFGASQARGTHITIMVDGARMLSPGVLSYTLAATRLDRMAVVAVPGYHLGKKLQQCCPSCWFMEMNLFYSINQKMISIMHLFLNWLLNNYVKTKFIGSCSSSHIMQILL